MIKDLPHVKISLHRYPSELSQKGAECYSCPRLGGTLSFTLLLNIVLKVLATEIRQERDMEWYK
jgi:hypothetical protein